jgi:hypothetical protein
LTQDQLKAAYERFEALPLAQKERLDGLCTELCHLLLTDPDRDGGVILPNRVSALLALEAAKEFEAASWQAH